RGGGLLFGGSVPVVGDRAALWNVQLSPFIYPSEICIASGRALRAGEGIALPPVLAQMECGPLDGALAASWLDDARAELASVPSFLRLADELRAVGAPAALRRAALDAADEERVLARIAPDEERHADLSRSILEWCSSTGGPAVRDAIAHAARTSAPAHTQDHEDAEWLSWNGRLTAVERSSAREQVEERARAR